MKYGIMEYAMHTEESPKSRFSRLHRWLHYTEPASIFLNSTSLFPAIYVFFNKNIFNTSKNKFTSLQTVSFFFLLL